MAKEYLDGTIIQPQGETFLELPHPLNPLPLWESGCASLGKGKLFFLRGFP